MRIVVTGSSGMIGGALTAGLRADGHEVVRLVRRAPAGAGEVRWDPQERRGPDPAALAGVDAAVNLAGAGIGDRRWTARYKATIRDSRVSSTATLVGALAAMDRPPGVLLSASGIDWYGDTRGGEVDESSPAGDTFLAGVVADWEAAADPAAKAGVRVVTLRSGVVLSPRGGVLARLLPLFRLGLGARLGPGTQCLNWITLADWIRAARFLLERGDVAGPVNFTAPHPVTNAEFTSALAAAVHRPALLTVPAPALALALGQVSETLLSSARVLPRRLQEAGFEYQSPRLHGALAAELASAPAGR